MTGGRRFWILTGAWSAVGLVLRLAWVAWATREPQGLYDPNRYLGMARNIAAGEGMVEGLTGHVTAYYPPGYPWFLGIVTWASEPFTTSTWVVAGVANALLGALTCVFGALVVRRLAGERAGVVAAAGLALYPNLIFHTGALLGETLYDALFAGFLVLVLWRPLADTISVRRALACGVVLGLAVMVRPISLAVVPVVVACWWLARRDLRVVARSATVLLVGVAACVVPWTVRNLVRMDALVVLSTNTGDNLCLGHGPDADGAFTFSEGCTLGDAFSGPAGEVAADREKTAYALRQIRQDPGREVWLTWRRFYVTWLRDGDHDGLRAVQSYGSDRWISPATEARLARSADIAYWVVVVAGLAGSVLLVARRRPEGLLLVGCAVMTAAVPLAFFGDSRFKVPVIPLLIMAAATLVGARGDQDEAEPVPAVP